MFVESQDQTVPPGGTMLVKDVLDLYRINDTMLRLKPESPKYRDLEWAQKRSVAAINGDNLSVVDKVVYFFVEVF